MGEHLVAGHPDCAEEEAVAAAAWMAQTMAPTRRRRVTPKTAPMTANAAAAPTRWRVPVGAARITASCTCGNPSSRCVAGSGSVPAWYWA